MLLGCQALVKYLQNMIKARDLPGSPAVKNLPCSAVDVGSICKAAKPVPLDQRARVLQQKYPT